MFIIDVEASSLGQESYPIEIGFSNQAGDQRESFLINPDTVERWDDWDPIAEETIHGISRSHLLEEGFDAFLCAIRLNKVLSGKVLYSDAATWDGFWIKRLFSDTLGRSPDFDIVDIDGLFKEGCVSEARLIFQYSKSGVEHRSLSDCDTIRNALACVPDEYWADPAMKPEPVRNQP